MTQQASDNPPDPQPQPTNDGSNNAQPPTNDGQNDDTNTEVEAVEGKDVSKIKGKHGRSGRLLNYDFTDGNYG